MNLCSVLALFFSVVALRAQAPEWIWSGPKGRAPGADDVRYFCRAFTVDADIEKATLRATADNEVAVWLNGQWITASSDWGMFTSSDVTKHLQRGTNILAARAQNHGGTAAFLASLEITLEGGGKSSVVTDTNWLVTAHEEKGWDQAGFRPAHWDAPVSLGKLGVAPWGKLASARTATPAEELTVPPGFRVELLHSATPEEGSWICLASDDRGRLIISPQADNQPLRRVTLDDRGQVAKIEPLATPLRQAMGLCWANGSLYVNGHGPKGTGLYRLTDSNQNDQFDPGEEKLLKNFRGDGEHGYHAVVAGSDGMIYVMNGNHTKVPAGVSTQSPHRNYAEDLLLPRMWDANGHAVGVLAPGGYVARTDPDGKEWSLFCAGFRNAYDMAFNPDGELFTFDSDMEWDWGAPWYVPIRINHCVSGGEYGWRSGSGRWPDYYPDSLPATANVGIGSPTGVRFGTGARFPRKYQEALFAMDWSYGRLFALPLEAWGASYAGQPELFLSGKAMPLTDLEIGKDGAMYLITGGRGLQSGLYRVSYTNKIDAMKPAVNAKAAEARALRHRLEAFHGKQDAKAVDFAWPHLRSEDRWIHTAARIAIESQPVSEWRQQALDERDPNAALVALLALARLGQPDDLLPLLDALSQLNADELSEEAQLTALRVMQLAFIRLGRPDDETAREVIAALQPLFPSKSEAVNRELLQVLVFLDAPGVVKSALTAMAAAPTAEDKLAYAFALRNVTNGWTLPERKAYFSWFNRDRKHDKHLPELVQWFTDAGRGYSDGASYAGFLRNIRSEAIAGLSEAEKSALGTLLSGTEVGALPVVNRKVVKEWTMGDVAPSLNEVKRGRNFERGQEAFRMAQCLACHRFGNEGGSVGPDITGVGNRFGTLDLLETIIVPSKVVSDQYQNTTVKLKDGEDVTGRLIEDDEEKLAFIPNPLAPERVEVKQANVKSRELAKLSPMPEGLLNILSKEEILDLLAFLESGGKSSAPGFKK